MSTRQKTSGRPTIQEEHGIWGDIGRLGINGHPMSKRFGGRHATRSGKLEAVIDVGNGSNIEIHRGEHSRQRKHDRGVRYESPLDTGGRG